jgi:hypothetical protein
MTTFLLARGSILTPGVVISVMMMPWTDSKNALFCAVFTWRSMPSPPTAGILDGTFGYLCVLKSSGHSRIWFLFESGTRGVGGQDNEQQLAAGARGAGLRVVDGGGCFKVQGGGPRFQPQRLGPRAGILAIPASSRERFLAIEAWGC